MVKVSGHQPIIADPAHQLRTTSPGPGEGDEEELVPPCFRFFTQRATSYRSLLTPKNGGWGRGGAAPRPRAGGATCCNKAVTVILTVDYYV